MKRWQLTITILTILLATSCGKTVQVSEYSIIPEPAYMVQKGRTYTLSSHTKLRDRKSVV